MINNTHTIYINKKPYKVSYLIYLCHLTGEFTKFESLDTYNIFFNEFRFSHQKYVINYLFNLDSAVSVNSVPISDLSHSTFLQFRSLIFKGGLFYAYLLTSYFRYLLNKENKDLKTPRKFLIEEIINTSLNYIYFVSEDSYKLLFPYLKFYKILSTFTKDKYISKNCIYNALTYLDIKLNIEDINQGLLNHGIILPYKNEYIWSSNLLLSQLKNMDHNIVNLYCLDLKCKKLLSNI
jgi:hypothetical protein